MTDTRPELTTRIIAAGPEGIAGAAGILRDGGLVAFPTETVYGLGGDATSDRAVAAIFAVKDRPRFNPLIIHLADPSDAGMLVDMDWRARLLAETLWPGPLTLVLPRRRGTRVSLLASAGLDSVAVRVPAHPVARRLLAAAGLPIAAPSANRSGRVSPTDARHVLTDLDGRIPLILAGGRSAVGLESTVLDLTATGPAILRPGAIDRAAIEAVIGPVTADGPPGETDEQPKSPGRTARHYAPAAPLRLNAAEVGPDEALLAFGPDLRKGPRVRNLSEKGDLREAAANLFAMLRDLDRPEVGAIAVSPIPEEGLGAAINDRLRRAALSA
ncbi:MAG: threonylcarbamoyl-AMP synthase [Alphaproteobacteria bacterium]|jgi:L-threonylcarbamoyladenylate synthase|nr:threonylcarbamoyl-AMP synthase [Alphaproteobacteria bacterium]